MITLIRYPALIIDFKDNTSCGYVTGVNGKLVIEGIDVRLVFKVCHEAFGKYEEYYPHCVTTYSETGNE